jgi:VIT1/CCC1 family predicted Fe2+/Mn2+ transporter
MHTEGQDTKGMNPLERGHTHDPRQHGAEGNQQAHAPIEELHPHGGDWLREIVFGLNDGLVTTLVFIMALTAVAHTQVALIALGEVLAGGISMALGGYLSARTTEEILAHRIATERYEIAHEPDEERAELRAIYRRKGLRDPLLGRVVAQLTADKERWLRAMVHDELGVTAGVVEDIDERPAWMQGLQVGLSFVAGGLIPAIPAVLGLPSVRWWSFGLTAITALALGAVKGRYTGRAPWRAGLEFLAIVAIGTAIGILVGLLLRTL